MSFLDSLGRGAAQGATSNFSDEAVAKLLAALPTPEDSSGIPREYAAGSPEQDYLNTERGDNDRARAENPIAYSAGSIAGALPSAAALPVGGGASAAGRVAAAGLKGGLLGGLAGAGHADGRDMATEAGKAAALGGGIGLGGGALAEGLPLARQVIGNMRSPEFAAGRQTTMLPPRTDVAMQQAQLTAPRASATAPTEPPTAGTGAGVTRLPPPPALPGEMRSALAERPTIPELKIDPKQAYREAAHRIRQAPAARGPQPVGDERVTMPVPPPKQYNYKNPAPSASATVPAPPGGTPTIPSPSSRATVPAPDMAAGERPTAMDLTPVRPTLQPASEQAYKDAVLKEMLDSARRASM